MKTIHASLAVLFVIGFELTVGRAMEMDFLQTDSRFTGGEFNANDPAHPNFWFYDQYQPARATLQAQGIRLTGVNVITLPNLQALSDMFYIPVPTNPSAAAYPLTDTEIDVLKAYTANSQYTGGRSVVFNLSGVSAAMTNDLLSRLGLTGHMATGIISGPTSYPVPTQPVINGPVAALDSFNVTNSGYFDTLGNMRSLIDVNGMSILPYVEKGDLSSTSGGYFFILDEKLVMDWASENVNARNLFSNLVEYAAQDQFLHFVPPSPSTPIPPVTPAAPHVAFIPEPGALSIFGLSGLAFLARRRVVIAPSIHRVG